MGIEFDLDDDQRELQGAVRSMLERAGGLGLTRAVMEDGRGWSRELWQAMTDMELPGLTIPEAHGGSGAGIVELLAVYRETGRVAAASPHLASSVIGAGVLASAGSDDQRAEWLPAIASGTTLVVPAVLETDGVWDERGIHATVSAAGDGLRVSGTKVLVPFAADAARLLVAARDGEGITLLLVDPATGGVSITTQPNLAGLPLFCVALDGAAGEVVGERGAGWAPLQAQLDRGAVLRAAEIAGAGDTMLDLSVAYANERVQFGGPIGRHQAVQYLCTDVAMEAHLTWLQALRAAWLLDQGDPQAGRAVAAAKYYASRAAHHMAQQAHEVFAGVAFMMEHDLHLLTRHAKHWEHDLGDVRHHAEALVVALEIAVPA